MGGGVVFWLVTGEDGVRVLTGPELAVGVLTLQQATWAWIPRRMDV